MKIRRSKDKQTGRVRGYFIRIPNEIAKNMGLEGREKAEVYLTYIGCCKQLVCRATVIGCVDLHLIHDAGRQCASTCLIDHELVEVVPSSYACCIDHSVRRVRSA
ncbi:hypothetical protein Desfe_0682 [Desulfurococcus amylolyticus DSM 16532]|uniref:Uncharacterized protein n=1 Tax=Desulfurococcus amylolyticus DSM 16532 TaxID=768672 RepID=I3XRK7_DESAM|nr:hypothetical protein Desfe_0682 [Desulfurococcus amylolyticus DSM 16532]